MATIKDIARKAGVAVSTASYALNGRSDKVNEETEAQILAAAQELNYRPNAIARSLVKQKTETISLFLLLKHLDLNTENPQVFTRGDLQVITANKFGPGGL